MVLSENPTVIQAIPKKPTSEQLEKCRKDLEAVSTIKDKMTNEEIIVLSADTGIRIINKDMFFDHLRVWRISLDQFIDSVSDITQNGNCILLSGEPTDSDRSLLFMDSKGNIVNKILMRTMNVLKVGTKIYDTFTYSEGGHGAIIAHSERKNPNEIESAERCSLSFYNERGERVWKSTDFDLPSNAEKVALSYGGETIAFLEGNPKWFDIEFYGGNLNINKIHFFSNDGRRVLEINGFRNISRGELSANGKYYAGVFWWQDEMDVFGYIFYVDIFNAKIMWQLPIIPGYFNASSVSSPWQYDLKISEKGTYVAVVFRPDPNDIKSNKIFVFNIDGKLLSSYRHSIIYGAYEHGLILADETLDVIRKRIIEKYIYFDRDGGQLWERYMHMRDISDRSLSKISADGQYDKTIYYNRNNCEVEVCKIGIGGKQ